MINFNHLRVFFYVAKNLSYTQAAKDLLISQPAATIQVKSLEEGLDLKLFNRRGIKIDLTVEGKLLFKHAQRIFEYEKELELAVDDIKTLRRGVFRIGTPRVFKSFMSVVFDSFHEQCPKVGIQVNEGSSLSLTHNLLDGEIEVAFIAKVEDNPNICFTLFIREELVCIANPDHKLAQKGIATFEDISKEPVVLREKGSGTRKVVLELFARNNCKPNILLETGNKELIKHTVKKGEGISFTNLGSVSSEIGQGKLVTIPIKDTNAFFDLHIAYLKNESLSLPAQEFLKILSEIEPGSLNYKFVVPSWPEKFSFLKSE